MKKLTLRFLALGLFLMSSCLVSAQPGTKMVVKTIFPRDQTYEHQMLKALGFNQNPSLTNIDLNETTFKPYAQLSPLEQIFGRLGLLASEIFAATLPDSYDAQKMLRSISDKNMPYFKPKVNGILAILVMNVLNSPANYNPSKLLLQAWAVDVFRSMKVRISAAILGEYQKWKNDPCGYKGEGYKPAPDCALKDKNYAELFAQKSPPQDIIAKAGLKSVLTTSTAVGTINADQIASVVGMGLSSAAIAIAGSVLTSTLGVVTATTGATISSVTTLSAAFASASGGAGGSAGAAIGSMGWASVVAAPVAAAVMIIIVGTTEGFRVVEAMKVEPMLKMKLGAAMTEKITLANVLNDISARDLFLLGFMEASQNGFRVTPAKINGEVRFYCQAGFVSKFKLSYSKNVDQTGWKPLYQTVEFNTEDLGVGREQSFPIPYDATNIKVQGWYAFGDWKPIFTESIAAPTYKCYTTYGTLFAPSYKTDAPEVGNMVAKPNELTVTQGGGYLAWVNLTYTQNGKQVVVQDQQGLGAGWRKVYSIPTNATNIRLYIQDATGWIGAPWKTVIDYTWPVPPNVCIKVYGTTLDPKWNNECN